MTAEPRTSQGWLSSSFTGGSGPNHQVRDAAGLAARYQARSRPELARPFGAPPTPSYPPQRQTPTQRAFSSPGARPPSIALVVIISLLFGLFGAIPAKVHADRAAAMGAPVSPYWIAFAVVNVIGSAMVFALAFFFFGLALVLS